MGRPPALTHLTISETILLRFCICKRECSVVPRTQGSPVCWGMGYASLTWEGGTCLQASKPCWGPTSRPPPNFIQKVTSPFPAPRSRSQTADHPHGQGQAGQHALSSPSEASSVLVSSWIYLSHLGAGSHGNRAFPARPTSTCREGPRPREAQLYLQGRPTAPVDVLLTRSRLAPFGEPPRLLNRGIVEKVFCSQHLSPSPPTTDTGQAGVWGPDCPRESVPRILPRWGVLSSPSPLL